jgi:hypothetical protein
MASNDTPEWLESSGNDAPTAPPPTTSTTSAATTTTSNAAVVPEEDKELPGIILVMRLANMGVSIALMACSVRHECVDDG